MQFLKISAKTLAIISIILSILLFFYNIISGLNIFVTPDFGQSDIFQLNLPLKYFLSESLKNNELPLWNKYVGNGFPQLAEGQMGTFNIINLLLFKFLPFPQSFNLGYIIIFFTTAVGTYCYCRYLKLSRFTSLYSSLVFSFSGFFVSHIVHFNLIQTASFLPIIFLITQIILKEKKRLLFFSLLLSTVLSQQLLSGFPQIYLITLTGAALLILNFLFLRLTKIKVTFYFLFSIILSLLLSSAQILPSKELIDQSPRDRGVPLKEGIYYSFPPKHFLTLFNPNALGNPKEGTYPLFFEFDGSVFWENSIYMGIAPLILLIFSLKIIKKNPQVKFYWILLVLSILLMMGKYSPFYLIYSFPPYSYFRVPSRFILLFGWSLTILSAFGLDFILNSLHKPGRRKLVLKYSLIIIVILSFSHSFYYWYNYNPIGKAEKWLKEPETSQFLKNTNSRYYSFGSQAIWNKQLVNGWSENLEPFLNLENALLPNLNTIYHVPSFQVYPILTTNRYTLVDKMILQRIQVENEGNIKINEETLKLLRMYNLSHIISPISILEQQKVFESKVNYQDMPSFKIYELPKTLPKTWVVTNSISVNTINQLVEYILSKDFDPEKAVILENKADLARETDVKMDYSIEWIKDDNQQAELLVKSTNDGFLISSDSYYPGWKAFIDGNETEIYPANINQRAIRLNKGEHLVMFKYQPKTVKNGLLISLITYLITIYLLLRLVWNVLFQKAHKIL